MTVNGSMACGEGFTAAGEVRLLGAQITGQLDLRGAQPTNPGGDALSAQGLGVGSLWLDGRFSAQGCVDLRHARMGTLYDDPARWPGELRMDGFVYDDLQPYREAEEGGGRLAWMVRHLPWPTSTGSPEGQGRLAWLARADPGYCAQPYEQLAAYYRRLGHDEQVS